MSETATETVTDQQPLEGDTAGSKTFDADYVDKLRKEAAKYRLEAKANADAAKRLADLEESNKSELQRAQERADAAEKAAVAKETESLRMRVALQKGVPADLVDRLRGDDEESLAADADTLLARLAPGRPTGSVDGGARGLNTPPNPAQEFASFLNTQLRQ